MPDTIEAPAVGTTMPDIDLEAPDAVATTLHALALGERAVVIFMRASTCPVCHAHVAEAVRMLRAGQLGGARLIVVTPGGADDIATVVARVPGNDVIVVGSGSAHAEVGLGRFLGLQHSGTFVLDERGAVLAARTAALPTGAFKAEEVLAALR